MIRHYRQNSLLKVLIQPCRNHTAAEQMAEETHMSGVWQAGIYAWDGVLVVRHSVVFLDCQGTKGQLRLSDPRLFRVRGQKSNCM